MMSHQRRVDIKVLFVTWDAPGQTYLESLFLPIFARLHGYGYIFEIVQFTWADANERKKTRDRAAAMGVKYTAYPVLRRGLLASTAWMIWYGGRVVARHIRGGNADVVMPRSIIPAAMAALAVKKCPGAKLVYDADGLMADERVDFAGWRAEGLPYRVLRDIEAQVVRSAQVVFTRTVRARDIHIARAGAGTDLDKIHVVVNGRDEELFSPGTSEERLAARKALQVEENVPWVVYAGSIGPQYYPEEMLAFFSHVHHFRSDARFLILASNPEAMNPFMANHHVPSSSVDIRRVPASEVPRYLAASDLGLALRKPTFSMRAVAPVKVGEYLLCGVPMVCTGGVGDIDAQLESNVVGKIILGVDKESLRGAAAWFVDEVLPNRERYREVCRATGKSLFGLTAAVDSYLTALRVCEKK